MLQHTAFFAIGALMGTFLLRFLALWLLRPVKIEARRVVYANTASVIVADALGGHEFYQAGGVTEMFLAMFIYTAAQFVWLAADVLKMSRRPAVV